MMKIDVAQASALARFFMERIPWIVLTGAGVSTESGIPDFRSPRTGLWARYDPMAMLSTDTLFRNPQTFYRVGYPVLQQFRDAEPNPAHQVLAEWERQGWIKTVVTQNIDSLHRKAGSQNVLEIHGHLRTCSCLRCRQTASIDQLEQQIDRGIIPPLCDCGGWLRPDVILFGDQLPEDFSRARKLVRKHPLLVIGSSLTVSPANLLPADASTLIIINLGETPCDSQASYLFSEKAGSFLPQLHKVLMKGREPGIGSREPGKE